jgi:hypothetical protein
MTVYYPIAYFPPQFELSSGVPASGYVLKAYSAGTSTPISMYTDYTGGTSAATITLNASGYPVVSSNVIIPHVSENFKLAIYPTQAAADANTGAVWTYDNIRIAVNNSFVVTNLDAGADGVAGTVDIFPATSANGKITIQAADASGAYVTTITNAAMAASRTMTIPDPGASASFVMTEGAQTINGVKNFGSLNLHKRTNAITAFAGGGQSSATALTSNINSITTCATAGDSVKLPTATAGSIVQVSNLGVAYADVFPASGDLIDALSANTAIHLPAGGSLIFTCAVTGSWKALETNNPPAKFTTGTTTTTFAAGQLTGAAFVVYTNTQGTPGSIATRTAAQMFTDDPTARVSKSYMLRIVNGQGTGTLTVTAGSNVTLTGTMTVALNTWRDFVVTYTSATALTIQNVGVGTFS